MSVQEAVTFLDLDITTAVDSSQEIGRVPNGVNGLTLQCKFTSGSGGTSAKAYIQTSLDGGGTYFDIACVAFTTTDDTKVLNLNANTQVTPFHTPVDKALADNTSVDGVMGDRLRIKYVTTGTYTGANLTISGVYNA